MIGNENKIVIQGLEYILPKPPPQRTMRNYGLPRVRQVWSRRTEYEQWDWDASTEEWSTEQIEWYFEEISRIYDGEWIFIGGEPTYINGMFYFFLQWNLLENEYYPEYRDTSLEYFRFCEIAEADPLCLGTILIKGRRLGASSMEASIMVRNLLIERNKRNGIISKTGDDAKDIFGFAVSAFQSLPVFLKPSIEGNDAPKKILSVKKQANRVTKGSKTSGEREGLNNELSWKSTAMNSYDSGRLLRILVDECLSPDTKIMMGDGSFKCIDEIQVGEYVMTEGSVPRRVMKRFDGHDNMYLVKQPYGKDYKVNSKHRLIVEHRMGGGNSLDGRYIINPVELSNKFPKSSYRVLNRVTSKGIDFKAKCELPIDPYLFGAWLGDGFSHSMEFVVNFKDDPEILEYLKDFAIKNNDGNYSIRNIKNSEKIVRFNFLKSKQDTLYNGYVDKLKRLNVFNNKHIPKIYLKSSIEDRLKVLAGIIDTDGYNGINHKTKKPKGSFTIAMSRLNLIEDIAYLAMSCGLSVSTIKHKKTNFNTDVYVIRVSGDLSTIPTKVKRKQYLNYIKQYNSRRNKISVEPCGFGRYVGIQVEAYRDEDRQLILEDFTLTMNCAKWLEVNIGEYWKIVQKCLTKGAMVVGKASFVSTVNRGDKGGDNFKSLWYDSDPDKRNSLNQTSSRLIRIFIPATRGYEGYIDRYGNSVVDTPTPEQTEYLKEAGCPNPYIGSKEFLEMQRDLVKHDPDLLAEEIRTAPFTWEEVFSTTSTVSHFHNIEEHKEREAELMEKLSELGRDVRKGELGRRGWFKKTPNGLVKFVDDPVGLWYIDRLLPEEESNKFEYKMKVNSKGESTLSRIPTNCEFGGAGWDTFSHGGSTAEKGSDACCIIRSRYSSIDPDNTGYPVAMFLGRMTRKGDVHEQLFNGLQYYGVKMLGELAPSDWRDYAEDNGYEEYCIITQRKSDGKVVRGINAQDKEAREQHLTLQVESALSDVNKIPFIRLIRDRIAFDINNRGDYDGAMADGYSLMALKEDIKKKKVKRTERVFFQKGTITSY